MEVDSVTRVEPKVTRARAKNAPGKDPKDALVQIATSVSPMTSYQAQPPMALY